MGSALHQVSELWRESRLCLVGLRAWRLCALERIRKQLPGESGTQITKTWLFGFSKGQYGKTFFGFGWAPMWAAGNTGWYDKVLDFMKFAEDFNICKRDILVFFLSRSCSIYQTFFAFSNSSPPPHTRRQRKLQLSKATHRSIYVCKGLSSTRCLKKRTYPIKICIIHPLYDLFISKPSGHQPASQSVSGS